MRKWIEIVESLSTTYPLTWEQQSRNHWFGTFEVGDEQYCVSATDQDDFPDPDNPEINGQWYDLAFGLSRDGFSGCRVLGTDGASFRIFSTAIQGFREFITAEQPPLIMLSASKENPNRIGLYRRMAKRFSAELAHMGYRPIPAPEHRYAHSAKYFDSLAWKRDEKMD